MAANKFTYQDYVESQKVKNAETALKNHNNAKPGEYTSQWQSKQNELLEKYQNRGPFSYDLASDTLYQQYADRYSQLGKMAMQDTMGQAATMTGGYGNSYAVTAGNQAFQKYLQGVNDVVPQLAEMAYNRYNQEGQDMLNLYGLYGDRENTDYSRWQDNMAYWESQRNYLADMYNNERNYDRGVYEGNRDFAYGTWSDDRNYNYQIERDKVTDAQWQKQFDEDKRQFNLNYNLQKSKSSGNSGNNSGNDNGGYTYTNNDKTQYVKGQLINQATMRYGSSSIVNGKVGDNNETKRKSYIESEIKKRWKSGELDDNEALSLLKDFGID